MSTLGAVLFRSLGDIEDAIRSSWSQESCDPVDEWTSDNPARGQCAVTALVVQDLVGGELLLAEVRNADGSRQGLHYWNRLAGGVELDLTREQFTATEIVQEPSVVPRPPDTTSGRLAPQYQTLATAVRARLLAQHRRQPEVREDAAVAEPGDRGYPVAS